MFEFSLLDMTPYSQSIWFDFIRYYYQTIGWLPVALAILSSLGLALIAYQRRPPALRLGLGLLALAWLWCGTVFLMHFYAQLNWAGTAFGWAFIAQSLLLAIAALWLPQPLEVLASRAAVIAGFIISIGVLLLPLSGLAEGRDFTQLALFALTPAPTHFASIGFILLLNIRWPWRTGLLLLPILSMIISALFAWSLGLLEAYWALVCLGLGLVYGWLTTHKKA